MGVRKNQGKFLAAIAGRLVRLARAGLEAGRDGSQYGIAGGMSVGIVVQLELIHVQHHDGQRDAVAPRPLGLHRQPFLESPMVLQARQAVLGGERLQSQVGFLQRLLLELQHDGMVSDHLLRTPTLGDVRD